MELARIREGDIVEIDKKGRHFLAWVRGKEPRKLKIEPFPGQNATHFEATSHEVAGHWKKMGIRG